MQKKNFTVSEAATYLEVSEASIRKYIRLGELKTTKLKSQNPYWVYIAWQSLEAFKRKHKFRKKRSRPIKIECAQAYTERYEEQGENNFVLSDILPAGIVVKFTYLLEENKETVSLPKFVGDATIARVSEDGKAFVELTCYRHIRSAQEMKSLNKALRREEAEIIYLDEEMGSKLVNYYSENHSIIVLTGKASQQMKLSN